MSDIPISPEQSQDQPLGDGGYKALQAERARAAALEAETKRLQQLQQQHQSELTAKYEIDLEAMRMVADQERDQLRLGYETKLTETQKLADERAQRLQEIEGAMVVRKITEDFSKVIAGDLVNPEMSNLLLKEYGNALVLDEQGNTMVQIENKLYPLDALKKHCQQTFPELFKPPSQAQGIGLNQFTQGTAPRQATAYVSSKDTGAFLRNLDAIAKGEVRVLE